MTTPPGSHLADLEEAVRAAITRLLENATRNGLTPGALIGAIDRITTAVTTATETALAQALTTAMTTAPAPAAVTDADRAQLLADLDIPAGIEHILTESARALPGADDRAQLLASALLRLIRDAGVKLHAAYNGGYALHALTAGLPLVWRTDRGVDVCDMCHDRDGTVFDPTSDPWGEPLWGWGGTLPPAHPNCRCTTPPAPT